MAIGFIPAPGTEHGPCKTACSHVDHYVLRTMAENLCQHCLESIGYERGFYIVEVDDFTKIMVHSSCHEDADGVLPLQPISILENA